jgi:hypothetical protein
VLNVMPNQAMVQHTDDTVHIRRASAQHHKHVHVGGTPAQRFGSAAVETPAYPKLHRGGECPLEQLIQPKAEHRCSQQGLHACRG